ncbi:MAG TPA: coiled coil domain-containing protein [Geopsychrobacteraceae bacterium]|jgi:uncharacterized protein YdcH (DUF465 family)
MSKKQAYEEKLEAQLDEWNAKINVLKAKAEKVEAEAKIEYHEMIETLKTKQAAAKNKLAELHNASDDSWEDLKEGVENAWKSLNAAVKSAASRFK